MTVVEITCIMFIFIIISFYANTFVVTLGQIHFENTFHGTQPTGDYMSIVPRGILVTVHFLQGSTGVKIRRTPP